MTTKTELLLLSNRLLGLRSDMKNKDYFDAAYFEKFYNEKDNPDYRKRMQHQAAGLTNLIEFHDATPASVLEIGAGIGCWRDWYAKNRPRTKYISTDLSDFTCGKYKHKQYDVTTGPYKGPGYRTRYDLVVCLDVMAYFDSQTYIKVLSTIASMVGTFLVIDALTKRDLKEVCGEGTDWNLQGQTAAFHKKALSTHFKGLGHNLYVPRETDLFFYELEIR